MNTRQEWLNTDYTSQFYSTEETINEVKENFDIRRYYSAEGANVIVDGIECRALVQYFTNPLNQAKYDRKLHVPMEISINTGSLIEYEGFNWLVTGNVDDLQAYKSAGMVKSNNTLTIYKNNTSYQIPCIISKSLSLNTEDNQYIETVDNELFLTVSSTLLTKQINVNDRYKIGLYNYSVKTVADDISNPGLLIFKMKYSEVVQGTHTYVLTILNNDNLQIAQSQSLIINSQLTDNGVIVTSPSLIYSSSDEEIATIDEYGVVSVVGLGSVVITVFMASDEEVSDSINVEIVLDQQDNFTYIIEGNSEIIKGYSQTYIAKKYNNGILVEGVEFTFSVIPGSTPTSAYILNIIDNDQCSITANLTTYYIILKATDNSNGMFIEKSIKLKNLF